MNFPNTDNMRSGVYRMERIRFAPILSSPVDRYAGLHDNITLTWGAWYNFRNKHRVQGDYTLYVNESEYSKGQFFYK